MIQKEVTGFKLFKLLFQDVKGYYLDLRLDRSFIPEEEIQARYLWLKSRSLIEFWGLRDGLKNGSITTEEYIVGLKYFRQLLNDKTFLSVGAEHINELKSEYFKHYPLKIDTQPLKSTN